MARNDSSSTTTEQTSRLLVRGQMGRTFCGCDDEVLDRLCAAGTMRTYAVGEYIVRKGIPTHDFLLVVSGLVENSVTHLSGHRHLFGFLRPGDCAGIVSLMIGMDHVIDHIARVPTTVLWIPNDVLMVEMQTQPALCIALLRQLAPRARIKFSRVTVDHGVPLPARLAWALQTIAGMYGLPRGNTIVLDLKLSQGDIADWLGVSRQHLHPHLKQLEKTGVISLGRANLIILDQERLAQLAVS